MADIEKTCENCEYEYENEDGEHCKHCIHNAQEFFEPKRNNSLEQKIKEKVIDEFRNKAIQWNNKSTKKVPYEFIKWATEQLKKGGNEHDGE